MTDSVSIYLLQKYVNRLWNETNRNCYYTIKIALKKRWFLKLDLGIFSIFQSGLCHEQKPRNVLVVLRQFLNIISQKEKYLFIASFVYLSKNRQPFALYCVDVMLWKYFKVRGRAQVCEIFLRVPLFEHHT